jgi:hypothetical protein
MMNLHYSIGEKNNLVVGNRDPEGKKDAFSVFWLNSKTKELFQYTQEGWISLTKEYIKIQNQPERSKREDLKNWMKLKDHIPPEKIHVLIWDGYSYNVGEILYQESDKIVFLCGSVTIENPILWCYLPEVSILEDAVL